jgi:hypothetical protein
MRYGLDVPCSDCVLGHHDKCDGEAWCDEFECVVDCNCLVCSRPTGSSYDTLRS